MNDYKELIARMREGCSNCAHALDLEFCANGCVYDQQAANAIETLTAQLAASEAARSDLARRLALAQQERCNGKRR